MKFLSTLTPDTARHSTENRPSPDASVTQTSSSTPVLETRDLCVNLGGRNVLDGVSVSFEAGRMHAVLGPNGCGKITLIRALTGSLKPSGGEVLMEGRAGRQSVDFERCETDGGRVAGRPGLR